MSIHTSINVDAFLENIMTSYESRIHKIQTAFQSSETITESSHNLFENVHQSLTDLKNNRIVLNEKLCETLAKNSSLRKKDYNLMMAGILDAVDEKEKEAESLFLDFIESQKQTAHELKESLLSIKDVATKDATQEILLIKEQLAQITISQEANKERIMKTFTNFQQLHNTMIESLEKLLEKEGHIILNDLKHVKDQINKIFN
jgi:predicted  nucleic acid-binding Zn-ribbon protein